MFDTPIRNTWNLIQQVRLQGTPTRIVLKPRLNIVTVRMNTGTVFEWSLEGFEMPAAGWEIVQRALKQAFRIQKTVIECTE